MKKLSLGKRQTNETGFSLIELMIVIAIIGLLIAVGVPAWGVMVRNGNEASAVTMVRQINEHQVMYAKDHGGEFATFDQLVDKTALNESLKGDKPVFNGYTFDLKIEKRAPGKSPSFSVNADPESSSSGTKHYYSDSEKPNIKFSEEGPATKDSTALGQTK